MGAVPISFHEEAKAYPFLPVKDLSQPIGVPVENLQVAMMRKEPMSLLASRVSRTMSSLTKCRRSFAHDWRRERELSGRRPDRDDGLALKVPVKAELMQSVGQVHEVQPGCTEHRCFPKEVFKREVERQLTGRETEPWDLLYFKLYKSQMPVIEQALETAALMLGTDKSRGYCLEMICADFLAGPTCRMVTRKPSSCPFVAWWGAFRRAEAAGPRTDRRYSVNSSFPNEGESDLNLSKIKSCLRRL